MTAVDPSFVLDKVVTNLKLFGLFFTFFGTFLLAFALHLALLGLHSLAHADVDFFNKGLGSETRVDSAAFIDMAKKVVDHFLFVLKVHDWDVEFGCLFAVVTGL